MNADMHVTPAEGGRGQGNGSGELVAHPATGELVGALESAPPERLADVWVALRERERELKTMRDAVTRELAARLHTRGRSVWAVGDFEVRDALSNRSDWDGFELELVFKQLIGEGVLEARELAGLLEHTIKVDGRGMNRLVAQLAGEAKRAVEACRTWRKERKTFEVVRSLPLVPAELERELER